LSTGLASCFSKLVGGGEVFTQTKVLVLGAAALVSGRAQSQPAPNVFNVLSWSSVFNQTVYGAGGKSVGVLNQAVPNIYAFGANGAKISLATVAGGAQLLTSNFQVDTSIVKVNNAVNSSIATALGVIPLASPASGVIFQTDPATGVVLPATSTLGPVFTERAETIGKRKWYLGFTHEDLHFTSLNGQSLNGLRVLYTGGTPSGVTNIAGPNLSSTGNLASFPATFDIGMDVRLSQNVAFITYGITDRLDVSVGLPTVHSAVAARTFNGIIYDGGGGAGETGATVANPNCWCAGSFNPGAFVSPAVNFTQPVIGQSSLGKTGFGDLLLRVKGTVVHNAHAAVAVGADLRFATGKAEDYLGTGTTSVKPFMAMSLYAPAMHGIVFAPHLNLGWQFSGQSVLGGQLQPNTLSATMNDGSGSIGYNGAPLTATKGYLPDVFSWALGSEVAFGRRNTAIVDILSNQIGWVHGAPSLVTGSAPGFSPTTLQSVTASGLTGTGTTSFSQYSGAFGYKARLVGNLVFTFSALVRFDNNGLTARFTPLYGLGYSF
jgi:hypothetical protein